MKEREKKRRPTTVFLHSTNKCKEWLRPLLERYASRGYIAVATDSRYHGERATSMTTYRDALVSSWKNGDSMPFIFDTVWDLTILADYLTEREDVDPSKIGITGESLGGLTSELGALLNRILKNIKFKTISAKKNNFNFKNIKFNYILLCRYLGFVWAVEHDKWQARVNSIKAVFEEARADLDKSSIDKEIVQKVWDRIAPGLASQFDVPYTVPTIAPRPLLILNGEDDPRCPLGDLEIPASKACNAYEEANCPQNFKGLGSEFISKVEWSKASVSKRVMLA
ncbi:hypothetical protein P3S67_025946 [Capsicum chacoense]